MNLLERLLEFLQKDPSEVPENIRDKIRDQFKEMYNSPPRIAVIGKTGVGKSTTMNALFDPTPSIRVGHVLATTQKPEEITVHLNNMSETITVIDFPGLGESIQADETVIPLYRKILPSCDVILWIFKADERALAEDQRYLDQVLDLYTRERLVFGINQIDKIRPGYWIEEYNVPSQEQEVSIEAKVRDIKVK